MEAIQAGITALITAYARAYHATHDVPTIFDDSLADQYFSEAEHTQFDRQLAESLAAIAPDVAASNPDQATALAYVMQNMHEPVTLSRSRYTEDSLDAAVREGVQQYVILGAGFDTFAFRRPQLLRQIDVFEVDHPVTQGMKRQRIAFAGWTIPDRLHLLPVDFAQTSLADALRNSSYDPGQLTFMSWLGVTYYLTQEVITETLRAISGIAPRGSTVVFDYMDLDAFDADKAAPRTRLMHGIARRVGEPMKSGFEPSQLAEMLQGLGFVLAENLSPEEIGKRYFGGRTDHLRAFEHVHFARAVIR